MTLNESTKLQLMLFAALAPVVTVLLYFSWSANAMIGVPAIVAVLFAAFVAQRGIAKALRKAIDTLDHAIKGKLSDVEYAGATSEVRGLIDSLNSAQRENRSADATDQDQATENSRIRRALDSVTANVMIADADNRIVYLNNTVTDMFRTAEADIRKQLPNFDVNNLMGQCMDVFHKDPSHQRSLVKNLSSTARSQIEIGGRTLTVIATPILDDDGTRLGTAVEWADRTQEVAVEKEVQTVVEGAVAGDLTRRIPMEGKTGFFRNLGSSVNELVEKLTGIVGEIQQAAESVNVGANEITEGNTNLSQRTEQQAASLEETASSMDQMTAAVRENAQNATQANQIAVAAREQAEKGGAIVNQAVTAMEAINVASKKISEIISVIDEIAFQTNLLALNAAVEAARAGEHGRGFAVVAGEVGNLAGRSAGAAKEIKSLIAESLAKVNDGSQLVNQSGEALSEIVSGSKKVTDIVGEIAASISEQSAGIDEINKAVIQMDELTQQNAALVEEVAAASESMSEQAQNLTTLTDFFTVELGTPERKRLKPVKAAKAAPNGKERRSSKRPWTAPPAPETAGATNGRAVAAAGGSDERWEEF